jgi:phosphoribosyl 1,2-cyclic phosphate phosphodiesterase
MELIILGSGGATTIPRPGCHCKVCVEARARGIPYARSGPSMFVSDINLLFDTPEELAIQLNREGINAVDYVFYTHWHPDHTMGMRIIERMNTFWLGKLVKGEEPAKKVKFCAPERVMDDLRAIKNKYGSYLGFYEKMGLIETIRLECERPFKIGRFEIVPFEVVTDYSGMSTVFLIKENKTRVIYAPCDVKPFPVSDQLQNPDLLIVGNFFPDGPLREGIKIPEDNVLRRELFSFKEILKLVKELGAKKTVLTHIEEEWGKSYDDYRKIEGRCEAYNIKFAYDGMRIKVGKRARSVHTSIMGQQKNFKKSLIH